MDILHHSSHEHPLRLRELFVDNEPPDLLHCGGCEFPLRGPTYCCDQCKFVLHRSCAEFPLEITHPFHSEHRLDIFIRELEPAWSDGHEVPWQTFAYHCSQGCGFRLEGVDAIATLADEEVSHERIWHMSHEHQLTACSLKRECKLECDGCKRTILGEAFVCYGCKFVLHKECAELPQSMQHPFHVSPLDLIFDPASASECSACKTPCILFYGCQECQYRLDVSCATSILTVEDPTEEGGGGGSVVEQSPHVREFTCFQVMSQSRIRCAFCSMFLSIGQACGSPGRCFFLHNSCAKEPVELSHPLHLEPEHHLTLEEIDKSDRYFLDFCSCCSYGSREYSKYHFKCQQCHFTLDTDCCLESLAFFQGGGNMHIKHPLHDHRLRFGRNPVQLYDTGEYYCEICAKNRHPDRGVYCCVACEFFAHIECALKERNLNVTDDVALKEIDDKIASLQAAAEAKWKELDDIASKLEALGRKIDETIRS
ncbi:hypothetical protein MLD38_011357 [Melastoma candidum]|uniref:Uncharacterized protein n=1 Tax=Melastoma candidum TaxID=119954 RepID=A0ACB9R6B8_9MYRT|nr:hypothetical protein MLD38_011357 [Melastoma candidum]